MPAHGPMSIIRARAQRATAAAREEERKRKLHRKQQDDEALRLAGIAERINQRLDVPLREQLYALPLSAESREKLNEHFRRKKQEAPWHDPELGLRSAALGDVEKEIQRRLRQTAETRPELNEDLFTLNDETGE